MGGSFCRWPVRPFGRGDLLGGALLALLVCDCCCGTSVLVGSLFVGVWTLSYELVISKKKIIDLEGS